MAKIAKMVNGERVEIGEVTSEFIENLGKPRICVCGVNDPKHTQGSDVYTVPVVGDIRAYIRYEIAGDLLEMVQNDRQCNMTGTVVVTHLVADYFGLDMCKAFADGIEAMEDDGIEVKGMMNFMADMRGISLPFDPPANQPLVVRCSANEGQYGAGVLANHKFMEGLHKEYGDFYIIPASVHEIIIVPYSFMDDTEELMAMVKQVNATVIEEGDVLSDQLLTYDSKGLHVV